MPEFYMILARKIYKIPEFYMIFARKMPEFYVIIGRKYFYRILGGQYPPTPMLDHESDALPLHYRATHTHTRMHNKY